MTTNQQEAFDDVAYDARVRREMRRLYLRLIELVLDQVQTYTPGEPSWPSIAKLAGALTGKEAGKLLAHAALAEMAGLVPFEHYCMLHPTFADLRELLKPLGVREHQLAQAFDENTLASCYICQQERPSVPGPPTKEQHEEQKIFSALADGRLNFDDIKFDENGLPVVFR